MSIAVKGSKAAGAGKPAAAAMPGGVTAPQTGNEYLDSLRDDRTVFIYGKRRIAPTILPLRRKANRGDDIRDFSATATKARRPRLSVASPLSLSLHCTNDCHDIVNFKIVPITCRIGALQHSAARIDNRQLYRGGE